MVHIYLNYTVGNVFIDKQDNLKMYDKSVLDKSVFTCLITAGRAMNAKCCVGGEMYKRKIVSFRTEMVTFHYSVHFKNCGFFVAFSPCL